MIGLKRLLWHSASRVRQSEDSSVLRSGLLGLSHEVVLKVFSQQIRGFSRRRASFLYIHVCGKFGVLKKMHRQFAITRYTRLPYKLQQYRKSGYFFQYPLSIPAPAQGWVPVLYLGLQYCLPVPVLVRHPFRSAHSILTTLCFIASLRL